MNLPQGRAVKFVHDISPPNPFYCAASSGRMKKFHEKFIT
ncbi:MAG: hypothetical protein ACJA1W_003683 [Akkermansiaceae bacterium]|jgi:hypothetical protein